MSTVFKRDMYNPPNVGKDFEEAMEHIKGVHASAATYKVEALCDILYSHLANHMDDIYQKIKEIANVVEGQEIRRRKAAAEFNSRETNAGDSKGTGIWEGKVRSLELDRGDGVGKASGVDS